MNFENFFSEKISKFFVTICLRISPGDYIRNSDAIKTLAWRLMVQYDILVIDIPRL